LRYVALIGINFYPEETAIGLYSTQMARYLSENNFDVSVITAFPYYPEWKIRREYMDKSCLLVEQIDKLHVYRYKQYVPEIPSLKNRILHLLDFTFGSFLNLFKVKQCDVVICVLPFIGSVFLGWILSRYKNAKFWVHIQDFEVDAIIESGLSTNEKGVKKYIFNFLFKVEKFLLNRADIVSTISHGMLDKLESKTKKEKFYLPNWVNGDDINPCTSSIHSLYEYHPEKFKILYSGNVGEKQDWEFFLDLVDDLSKYDAVHIYVVGQGAKFLWLKQNLINFKNVTVREPVRFDELNDLLCNADLHVLFQKKNVVDTVMPSKILGMMASAVPSLVTGDLSSEVAIVFSKSQKEGFYEPEDKDKCLEFIDSLIYSKVKRENIGMLARSYILENFDSESVLSSFNSKLTQLISCNK
jgi:colanic acid biosynthesis glycosyl transferase WcaI